MTSQSVNQKSNREVNLRRAAKRQGLRVRKTRRTDPRALDYGNYWLHDRDTGAVIVGGRYGATLDEIETALNLEVNRATREDLTAWAASIESNAAVLERQVSAEANDHARETIALLRAQLDALGHGLAGGRDA